MSFTGGIFPLLETQRKHASDAADVAVFDEAMALCFL
jgi:hypothetical protein